MKDNDPWVYDLANVKQAYKPNLPDDGMNLCVECGDMVELANIRDRGWRCCRKGEAAGWAPDPAFSRFVFGR